MTKLAMSETKDYIPLKDDKEEMIKDTNANKRPPPVFFLFCSEHHPKIKSEPSALSIGDAVKKNVKCGLNSQPKTGNHMNKNQLS